MQPLFCFYVLLHAYLFLSRCFWIFKFPIRSQKLICLMCVWLVFVPLKLLRLFTEKKKTERVDFSQCRTPFGLTLDAVQILTVLASLESVKPVRFYWSPTCFFDRFPCVGVLSVKNYPVFANGLNVTCIFKLIFLHMHTHIYNVCCAYFVTNNLKFVCNSC